jgi:hypothetical protein
MKSNKAIMPTMIVSIRLKLVAEGRVKGAHQKEGDDSACKD